MALFENDKGLKIKEAESLELKNKEILSLTNKFISNGISPEQAKANAEMQIFTPRPLPDIKLQSNTQQGRRKKLFFLVTEEEYKIINEKFKIVKQFEEDRIASSCTNEFVEKILK